MRFTFQQGGKFFMLFVVFPIIGFILLLAVNPHMLTGLLPKSTPAPSSNVAVIKQQQPQVEAKRVFTYAIPQSQFSDGHHHLVCDQNGAQCNFGIYHADTNTFDMGLDLTQVTYTEDLVVFPHVDEKELVVGQVYAECTLTTYHLVVNGAQFEGCFEGTFTGRDDQGYHFLSNGQPMNLPHTHGAFLEPNSH